MAEFHLDSGVLSYGGMALGVGSGQDGCYHTTGANEGASGGIPNDAVESGPLPTVSEGLGGGSQPAAAEGVGCAGRGSVAAGWGW